MTEFNFKTATTEQIEAELAKDIDAMYLIDTTTEIQEDPRTGRYTSHPYVDMIHDNLPPTAEQDAGSTADRPYTQVVKARFLAGK
jgi:hypothetical protein